MLNSCVLKSIVLQCNIVDQIDDYFKKNYK